VAGDSIKEEEEGVCLWKHADKEGKKTNTWRHVLTGGFEEESKKFERM
jgi:hypothetical protein